MKTIKILFVLTFLGVFITSCSEDPTPEVLVTETDKDNSLGKYNGIIISAEGNFQSKDGSVSFVNNNLKSLATNFIYTGENNAQLGGLIQSIAFHDDNAYIILNDVNTIVVANRYTFKKTGTIETGLLNPRYMAFADGKGYVTNWGEGGNTEDDYIAVIDLKTNTIESTKIALENGVEQIVSKDKKLYVTHKGANSSNNIVSVVNLNNNNAVSTIKVNDNPDEIVFDNTGNLIVLSEGKPSYDKNWIVTGITTSSINFINTTSNKVTKTLEFAKGQSASLLSYENGKIYYYKSADKKVYVLDQNASKLTNDGAINVEGIYGMSVKDDKLYTVKRAFTNLSNLSVIDLISKKKIYNSAVGLGASKIYFN